MRDYFLCYPAIRTNTLIPQPSLSSILQNQLGVALDALTKIVDLNKLTPTEISLQMADKSTAIPIDIFEDVPIVVANVTILIDFVILEMPEDDNMSIILGRPFLNTAGVVIDCNKSKVTFSYQW